MFFEVVAGKLLAGAPLLDTGAGRESPRHDTTWGPMRCVTWRKVNRVNCIDSYSSRLLYHTDLRGGNSANKAGSTIKSPGRAAIIARHMSSATCSVTRKLPNISTQMLECTVSVPDGGTLLLGGQRTAGEVEREMGVPILSKIPVLNRITTNRAKVSDSQTLLILVKPMIIIQREYEEDAFPPGS